MPNLQAPVDNKPWPAERFYRDAPLWSPSGVVAAAAATSPSAGALGLSFAVAGSVITVSMALGRARVMGMLYERTETSWSSGMVGDQPHDGSAAYPLNTTTQPRVDRLVLRRDLAAGTCYPLILQGTPAASPVAPALTQDEKGTWDFPLHRWQLAGNSSTAISNIVDERRWIDPLSGREVPGVRLSDSAAFSMAAGWTLSFGFARRLGSGLAVVYLNFARAAGATTLAVSATGDVAPNVTIATMAAGYEPLETMPWSTGGAGRMAAGILGSDGVLQLAHTTPGANIVAGDQFSLAIPAYPLAFP